MKEPKRNTGAAVRNYCIANNVSCQLCGEKTAEYRVAKKYICEGCMNPGYSDDYLSEERERFMTLKSSASWAL